MSNPLPNPFYYLDNFHTVLEWIAERYSDLLAPDERDFIARFPALPGASRALLVRMAMRKGELFRAGKLRYDEIGCPRQAAAPLLAEGWIDDRPLLTIAELFAALKKSEIAAIFDFPPTLKNARKADQLEALRADAAVADAVRTATAWGVPSDESIYRLRVGDLCDRLRLMFFGNLHQDWSEFVLSELGIYKYEKVVLSASSRGFHSRRDIDDYLHLHRCRERFLEGAAAQDILPDIPTAGYENPWLESRRAKLLFRIGQQHEQSGELSDALRVYSNCPYPGARLRAIRVLERSGDIEAAFALAGSAANAPESETEKQHLLRIAPRLRRRLGMPKLAAQAAAPLLRHDLTLSKPVIPASVEMLVRDHLTQTDAPAHYVENALINSLFGLLCWDAIFAAVPGAFFHPFQSGPADLLSPDFLRRRAREFETCLARLDGGDYRQAMLHTFDAKAGTLSPFVYWDWLSDELLTLALDCIPAAHLRKCFDRMLQDIGANRAGYPDLIQFWPAEKRYRMIEVKGPGDRLQDNQLRWLSYCAAHDMPVTVCYVQWAGDAA
ncbi:MAG: hypothetical protein JWP38_3650 [Herbaspirillum sp.]|nr:hypothetical protein [Herbaspirillum sp.]